MKKLAGRDFEDLLQCAIPVFERLLPEPHNRHVMKLLFCVSEWHGLAKLRMHTAATLARLEQVTTDLGYLMRDFQHNTCAKFKTTELEREFEARKRRKARKEGTKAPKESRKVKSLNLCTYKFHALGDYVRTIRMFGTTDSFSSQVVCGRSLRDLQSLNSSLGRIRSSRCETLVWSNQQAYCDKTDRSTIPSNGGCPARTEEITPVEFQNPTRFSHPT